MKIGEYRFDRLEFSGSLGDLGTIIPLSVALIIINGLSVTSVTLMLGLSYIFSGLYFKLPIPVQPLKVVAAVAIASPENFTSATIASSGIIIGVLLLLLTAGGLIDRIAGLFTKPLIRGIQLGLGLMLIRKGLDFLMQPGLFIQKPDFVASFAGIPVNLLLGIAAFFIALLLLSSKRFPSALVVVSLGFFAGVFWGAFENTKFELGPEAISVCRPSLNQLWSAFILLVIPQIPLTIGNAIIGTNDACNTLFKDRSTPGRTSVRAFAFSMGIINIIAGIFCAMPMCHGQGGLAAHHRFGARTGGSNIMIGAVFILVGLVLGKAGIYILTAIPNAVLGVLLLFAGMELAILVRDVRERNDLFLTLLVAGIGFSSTNMGLAVLAGFIVMTIMKWRRIDF
jgi:SulP family sulfate permease